MNSCNDYIIVSMYAGSKYYYDAADKLRADCDRLGIQHDIVEVQVDNQDWIDICRQKVQIYFEKLIEHKKPIFWIDVDTDIIIKPQLPSSDFDVGIFMRNFNYLPTFNATLYARRFEPGYLYFAYNDKTVKFLTDLSELEKNSQDVKATDDFFLQETFVNSSEKLRILLFSNEEIVKNKSKITERTMFVHGASGNVKSNQGIAVQHQKPEIDKHVKKHVLVEQAIKAGIKGQVNKVIYFYEAAQEVAPDDLLIFEKLFLLYTKKKMGSKLNNLRSIALSSDSIKIPYLKLELVESLKKGNFLKADSIRNQIVKSGDVDAINFMKSKVYRYSFDRRAKNMKVPEELRIKMFWWESPYPGNLGDVLSPYIVEKVTGVPPQFCPRTKGMLAIGSIIKWATKESVVWGSGTSSTEAELSADAKYYAVRGPYTRKRVIECGGECPEIYGDPAWILPKVYNPTVEKTHKIGLILHYTHEDNSFQVADDIKQISIRRVGYNEIEEFLNEMLSCEMIISTSLHGVIIANAYNIPVIWATVSNAGAQVHGDGMKFLDYFTTIGNTEITAPYDLAKLDVISEECFTDNDFFLPNNSIDIDKLIESAPFFETINKAKEWKKLKNTPVFMAKSVIKRSLRYSLKIAKKVIKQAIKLVK